MICILHRSKHHINAGPLDAEKSHSNGEGIHKYEAEKPKIGEVAKLNHGETKTEMNESGGHIHSLPTDHGDNYYDHEVGADDIKMNEMKMHQENSNNKEQEQIMHPKSHDGVCKIHEDVKLDSNEDIFGQHVSGEERPPVAEPMPMSA
ncbi:hypothetical protein niasHT_038645 [Heterodera trifolii]|uniref:Uncharacterized protein n=1 Tax=Heterodera trifolii TaxID=157864 RepID=A0ABD2HV88_9BILA